MASKLATHQDVMRRLDNTICKYKGVPYYIKYNVGHTVNIYPIADAKAPFIQCDVDYTSPDFDYGFPEVGYMNLNQHAYYIERISGRDQRMGLPPDMLRYVHGKVNNALFRSKGMENMLLNIYPDVREAVRLIKAIGATSVALSRDYALDRNEVGDLTVLFHDIPIATCGKGEDGTYQVRYKTSIRNVSFFMRSFKKYEDELVKVKHQ